MLKLIYAMLLVGTSLGVGLAGIAAFFRYKLWKLTGSAEDRAAVYLDAGIALLQGVLVARLISLGGSQDASGWAWAYVAGLMLLTIGLARTTVLLYTRLADTEVEESLHKEEVK